MTRSELERKYRSGRLPARIWILSCLAGSAVACISLLVNGEHLDSGFFVVLFRTLIGNMLWTIPVFFAQAHFVCKALLSEKRKEMMVLVIILVIGLAHGICVLIREEWNIAAAQKPDRIFFIADFCAIVLSWVIFSFYSIRSKE